MKNTVIFTVIGVVVVVGAGLLITRQASTPSNSINESTMEENQFLSLTSSELEAMLEDKDFTLIDVHTPEQQHVPKTDYLIPHTEIDIIVDVVPDTAEKVVLYCRSGNMSKIAAQELIDRGYTNVYELTDGMNGWLDDGKETLPIGSVNKPE